jgi:hypothetical protein
MTTLAGNHHFTVDALSRSATATHAGQPHWAGTGPAHTYCKECAFWKKEGRERNHRCSRYSELMQGRRGPAVPGDAASCKYFQRSKS